MSNDLIKGHELKENPVPAQVTTASASEQTMWARLVSTLAKIFAGLGGIWLILEIVSYFIPEKPLAEYRVNGLAGILILGIFIGLVWDLVVLQRNYILVLKSLDKFKTENAILKDRKSVV